MSDIRKSLDTYYSINEEKAPKVGSTITHNGGSYTVLSKPDDGKIKVKCNKSGKESYIKL